MEKIQTDVNEYILYSPDSLKYITDAMTDVLDESIVSYKSLFEVSEFRKIQINFFDNLEKFREYIYSLRGGKRPLPEYATGTFDNGMINAFISPDITTDSPLYNKKLYMASHELFHIMYKELIYKKENKERIIWFDEGMAQLFSGEFKETLNEFNFKKWFDDLINSTEIIPDLNELKHGSDFENDKYSGYKLSLLAVKYLSDILEFNELKKLMHDTDKIRHYGTDIVNDSIKFYNNLYKE